jgi:uncharacterized protein YndB with AHSA1/START domain
MSDKVSDSIEKTILVEAPLERVWAALMDVGELGSWFGANLAGAIEPGSRISGPVTHPGMEHLTWEAVIESVEPPRLLSWRWHPHGIELGVDYSAEPTTLVAFHLEPVAGGTMVRLVESGFDGIPVERRAQAFEGNSEGWGIVLQTIRQRFEERG